MLLAAMVVCLAGCRSTKYVEDGDYLLKSVKISGDLGDVDNDECFDYVRQRPNASIFGFFHPNLSVYNLSRPKDTRFNNWLRKIGEAPVVYDSAQTARTTDQLRLYMNNRGYFGAMVRDTMIVKGSKKCAVVYEIEAGEPQRISHIGRSIDDDTIRGLVMADTASSFVRVGDIFDVEKHDAERARIARQLNQEGYYQFRKDHIYFLADSTVGPLDIADSLVVIDDIGDNVLGMAQRHKKAVVDDVWIVVNKAGEKSIDLAVADYDTTSIEGLKIAYRGELPFAPKLMLTTCFVRPGQLYNVIDAEQTQSHFLSMPLFGGSSLRFVPQADTTDVSREHLMCLVSTTIGRQQSYSLGIEGTNSSGNLGAAGSLGYRHANIFRKAEQFDVKWRLATQNQFARDGKERFFTVETGVEIGVSFPHFVVPIFDMSNFDRNHNTSTRFSTSYDYQHRPDFTKHAFSALYGYTWTGHSRYVRHSLTPVELNVVRVSKISDDFKAYIEDTYLKYSYTDHFIMSTNYTYLLDQQRANTVDNAWYVRFSAETAGNFLDLVVGESKAGDDGVKQFLGIDFAQYVKTDLEVRYQVSDLWGNRFVVRAFGGIGIPYGNSKGLPFEKSYYVGGANSIRAWPVRGLGPGSSSSDNGLRYSNQTGDIRLEANAEYRFNIISIFEGAVFADAGNIWQLPRSTDDEEAIFSNDFYNQIALGAGIGFRFNFGYFVLRLDAAVKLRDPTVTDGSPWVIAHQKFSSGDINYNFAIGYPF